MSIRPDLRARRTLNQLVILGVLLVGALALARDARAQSGGAVVLHDVDVVADSAFIRGTEATVYVSVSGATDLTESHPLGDAQVELWLEASKAGKGEGEAREMARARTRADGTAVLRFDVPRSLATGSYVLMVKTRSAHGAAENGQTVTVSDATQLHVRTDRGIYRPGQKLRWRVMAVNTANAHPLDRVPVDVSIKDPSGTAIWSGRVETGDTGMVHGAVPLDTSIILGSYTVSAEMGDVASSTTVKIRAYKLPAFTVEVVPETPGPYAPGQTIRGHVVARYLQGEPVSGQVVLGGTGVTGTDDEAGALDAFGRMPFTVRARHEGARLRAMVKDGAQRVEHGELSLPMRAADIEVALIPERESFIAGARNHMTVLTTDGDGGFVSASVRVRVLGKTLAMRSRGALRIPIEVDEKRAGEQVRVEVLATDGERTAEDTMDIEVIRGTGSYVRPEDAVVEGGSALAIDGRWQDARGKLVVTLMRESTPVATSVVQPDDETGAFRAYVQPPPGVFGLATVRVTDARWDEGSGRIAPAYAQATVYLRPTRLDVTVAGKTRYRPGQRASMEVEVRDRAGRPMKGAGLAASVVDERVLLLGEPGPDLSTALRELGMGNARAAGLVFARLLGEASTERARLAMRALVESLPPDTTTPQVHISAAERFRQEIVRMGEVRQAVYDTLLIDARAIGVRVPDAIGDDRWEFAHSLDQVLRRARWKAGQRQTPWKETLDWGYARRLTPGLTFDALAPDIATERLERLAMAAVKHSRAFRKGVPLARLAAQGKVPRFAIVDPWGTAIRVQATSGPVDFPDEMRAVSAGPDRVFGTDDDIVREHLLSVWGYGYGVGGGLAGMRDRPTVVPMAVGRAAVKTDEVAVRRNFDQTVLWVAGVKTDAHGRHTLEVPLADSITGWRVDVQALGPRGAMGNARARLETALPEYMDVDMPYALTLGDVYHLPVIVANHGAEQKTLLVQAWASGGLALEDAKSSGAPRRVSLPAGATSMLTVAVRARSLGQGVMDLTLSRPGGEVLDRTQHTLRIEAPGRLERAVYTAEAGDDGALGMSFKVPENMTSGTARGTLRLYRGVTDQALDGIEGLLREPHGCFEQTSSSTYPNLLVLRLLDDDDDEATGSVRERAHELVAKGYQRLISYEVPGGGFSWFGEAPANQVLTAYGLMEFVDMSAVYPVDPALVERTRAWLLSQQQADGSWDKDASWLHDWSAVQGKVSTTAYIAWALAESGHRGRALDRAFAFLRAHREELAENPYLLALWSAGESAYAMKGSQTFAMLREKFEATDDGAFISAGGKTLFYTSGKGADVQVTALGAVALGRHGQAARGDIDGALAWMWNARDARSGWGTTQGTVLALRAYAMLSGKKSATGRVKVRLDGALVSTLTLDEGPPPTLELPTNIQGGRHQLTLEPADDATDMRAVRADLRTSWRTGPARRPVASGLGITLSTSSMPVRVGQRMEFEARLENGTSEVMAMPTVVIPVPPGFAAVAESLDALERSGTVERAEDMGSEIHLYMTQLDAGASVKLPYRLEATAACEVTQRSAQAYAYYDPETRGASAELRLHVLPRK